MKHVKCKHRHLRAALSSRTAEKFTCWRLVEILKRRADLLIYRRFASYIYDIVTFTGVKSKVGDNHEESAILVGPVLLCR